MEEIIQRAILVGVDLNNDKNFDYSVEELKNLAEACSVEVADVLTQKLERVNSAHYIGSGKVEEVAHLVAKNDANLVIFNDELSPSQIRNLEHELQCKVIDRTILILDIFASRAKTREAQLQVEVAQLKYMMPRLIGLNASLSRQAGGIGSKGPGEKKLELDRRRIEEQIHKLSTQEAVRISAKNLTNIDTLINSIKSHLFHHSVKETFLIPYDKGNIISYLNDHATVFETEYLDNGTLITVECSDQDVERFHQYKKSSLL